MDLSAPVPSSPGTNEYHPFSFTSYTYTCLNFLFRWAPRTPFAQTVRTCTIFKGKGNLLRVRHGRKKRGNTVERKETKVQIRKGKKERREQLIRGIKRRRGGEERRRDAQQQLGAWWYASLFPTYLYIFLNLFCCLISLSFFFTSLHPRR